MKSDLFKSSFCRLLAVRPDTVLYWRLSWVPSSSSAQREESPLSPSTGPLPDMHRSHTMPPAFEKNKGFMVKSPGRRQEARLACLPVSPVEGSGWDVRGCSAGSSWARDGSGRVPALLSPSCPCALALGGGGGRLRLQMLLRPRSMTCSLFGWLTGWVGCSWSAVTLPVGSLRTEWEQ